MSFRRNWVAGCLFVGLVLHTLAASALAVQTPTDGSGPDRQLEVVLGHVETELSGHPRIIHTSGTKLAYLSGG